MAIPAIILAAGASRRLGQPKQLVAFGNEALLERAMRLTREAGTAPVLVVLGANFAPICASVPFGGAIPVMNEKWEQGLSTSIHAGLTEAAVRAPEASGVLLLPCDLPRLTASHLQQMLKAFERHVQTAIVASSYAGIRGVPAIFPRIAFPALFTLEGDKGARPVIERPPCAVIALPFPGGDVDIDVPADLARLK